MGLLWERRTLKMDTIGMESFNSIPLGMKSSFHSYKNGVQFLALSKEICLPQQAM